LKIVSNLGALTYCTNIHPGEEWPEVRSNVATHVAEVKKRLSPDAPFGIGLRLSERAARALAEPDELARFRDDLAAAGLYVVTINGFPYGPFHGKPVKEQVYRPDWQEPERLAYTDLAHVLTPQTTPMSWLELSASSSPTTPTGSSSTSAVWSARLGEPYYVPPIAARASDCSTCASSANSRLTQLASSREQPA
jgi:hypothetical protein